MAEGSAAAAVVRSRIITLPGCGKTVEVRRWSYQRALSVARYMDDMLAEAPNGETDPKALMHHFFDKGGDAFLQVARLSLSPADAGVVDAEIDAVDAFALIEAAFEINETAKILKNAFSLAGQFTMGKLRQMAQTRMDALAEEKPKGN